MSPSQRINNRLEVRKQHISIPVNRLQERPQMGKPEPLSLPRLLDTSREALELLYPGTFIGIYLTHTDGKQLMLRSFSNDYLPISATGPRLIQPGEGITGYVANHLEALIVDDVRESSLYTELRPTTRSELCMPVCAGKALVAIINIESDTVAAFHQHDIQILKPFAKILAHGILYSESHDREGLFKQLVDNMNEAVWVGDHSERTIYANRRLQDLIEYSLEEMADRESYEFWDDASAKRVRQTNESDRRAGKTSAYEGNLKSKSGKLIPVRISGAPLPDGGTVGIMTDLRELRETEAQFKQLVEYMNEGVIIQNSTGKITYVNPKLCKWLGFAPEDLNGKALKDILVAEDSKPLDCLKSNLLTATAEQVEAFVRRRDGSLMPVLLSCAGLPGKYCVSIITNLTDIREREARIRKLSAQDHLLATITKYSVDGIVCIDNDLNVISWNDAAETIFGYTAEEMVGKSIMVIVPPDRLHELEDLRQQQKFGDSISNFETIRVGKSGEQINVSLTFTVLFDDQHNKIGSSIMYRNITQIKKRERELHNRYEKLQEAYRELGRQRRQVDYLVDLIDICVEESQLKKVADFIASAAVMLTHVDACILRLYNKETQQLRLLATHGVGPDWNNATVLPYEGSLLQDAVKQGEPIKILDVINEPRYVLPELARKHDLAALIMIPLIVRGVLIGSLALYLHTGQDINILDDDFIPIFSKQAAITLDVTLRNEKRKN